MLGSIVGVEPLGVAEPQLQLAWKAAFADPRLPALMPAEYPSSAIKISVLTPMEPVLEAKAGLRRKQWPRDMEAWRYRSADYRRRTVDIDRRSAA